MYPLHVAALPEEATLDNPSETPFVLDAEDYKAHQALTLSIMKSLATSRQRGKNLLSCDEAEWMTNNALMLANEIFKEYVEMHCGTPKRGKYTLSEEEHEYDLAVYIQHRKLTLQLIAQHIHKNYSVNAPIGISMAKMVSHYSLVAHRTLRTYRLAMAVSENSIPNVDF